jgi:hypothetical protein
MMIVIACTVGAAHENAAIMRLDLPQTVPQVPAHFTAIPLDQERPLVQLSTASKLLEASWTTTKRYLFANE